MISDWRVDQADLPDTFQHVWGKLTRFVEEAVSPTVMEEVQTRLHSAKLAAAGKDSTVYSLVERIPRCSEGG